MRKAALGDVATLSELISDLRYCRNTIVKGKGSYTRAPSGYHFIAVPRCSWRGKRPGGPQEWVLYGKPTAKFLDAAEDGCIGGSVASVEIIPWPDHGKALVLARDSSHIGAPWVAFIPLSEVPTQEFLESLPLEELQNV